MQLNYKLTDRNTGANVSPSKYVIDPEQEGVLIQVLGGETLDHDAETSDIVIRVFTGQRDSAGNKIYEGDILLDGYGDKYCVQYRDEDAAFVCLQQGKSVLRHYALQAVVNAYKVCIQVVGNRWQPEFKGVFGDAN
jgi:hypothetical protein